MGALIFLWTWGLHRQWWRIRGVRRATWIIPLASLTLVGIWALASMAGLTWLSVALSTVASFILICSVALGISLPVSGIILTLERLIRWIVRSIGGRSPGNADASAVSSSERALPEVDLTRRSIVTGAAAIIPLAAVTAGAAGVVGSFADVTFPQIPLTFANLPAGLEGLRILHLTDIHLGYYVGLDDLERTLLSAEKERADILLVSGDISDDIGIVNDAIGMLGQFRTRYGTFASIGNHEYYRGVGEFLQAFERVSFPLLRENGATLTIGGSRLHIAGADDPARDASSEKRPFLERSVAAALDGAPSDAFHLLMSHRPEGIEAASRNGVELTVSGHTHGGLQMGFNGRGLFESIVPDSYLWGHYRVGNSQLYTAAGTGHWFPFRLGVPREAPVYTLRRG
jgi:predicted MPP superfamily phosphohydrolase